MLRLNNQIILKQDSHNFILQPQNLVFRLRYVAVYPNQEIRRTLFYSVITDARIQLVGQVYGCVAAVGCEVPILVGGRERALGRGQGWGGGGYGGDSQSFFVYRYVEGGTEKEAVGCPHFVGSFDLLHLETGDKKLGMYFNYFILN